MSFDPTLVARVPVPPTADIAGIVAAVGADTSVPGRVLYANGLLTVRGVSQAALEDAAADPDVLFVARMQVKAAAKAEMQKRIAAGLPFMGKVADIDEEQSIPRINGAATMAMLAQANGAPFSIQWRMQDNTFLTLDAYMMLALGSNAGSYFAAINQRYWQLTDAAMHADSKAELDAIDVETGWPAAPADPPINTP